MNILNSPHCNGCPLDPLKRKYFSDPSGPTDILVILESPHFFSVIEKRLVVDEDPGPRAVSYLINSTIDRYKGHVAKIYKNFEFNAIPNYTYAVSCVVDERVPTECKLKKENKPSSYIINRCNNILFDTIRRLNPKVIIPVGEAASKALFIQFKKFNSVVARKNPVVIYDKTYVAVPIIKADKVASNDNKFAVSQLAVWTAIDYVFQGINQRKENIDISKYHFPKTPDEVRDLCRNVIIPQTSGENRKFLAVDVETNTRDPWRKDAKVTMISFSWGEAESCAIWYKSKHSPYDPKEVGPYIKEVLESNSRKVFHNAKFDYKFLTFLEGFYVRNLCWDTMLTEHILNENMKGFYNLEFLAGYYFPVFENYKKLALKKVSSKDNLPFFNEDQEVNETFLLNSNTYQEEIKQHENLVHKYKQDLKKYKEEKKNYEWALTCWKEKYKDIIALKVSDYKKEERKQVSAAKAKVAAVKPKKTFGKKPVKPGSLDLTKYEESTKENFEDYDPRDLEIYCAMDGDITRRIAERQKEIILKEDSRMLTIIGYQHVPATKALADMEYQGATTNQGYLDRIEAELRIDYERLNEELIAISNMDDFKPNSPQQIGIVLHSKLGIEKDPELTTATGWPKTDVKSLLTHVHRELKTKKISIPKELAKDQDKFIEFCYQYKDNPIAHFIGTLLKFRDVGKAYKTTISNFRKYTEYDKKLRSNFHINGTVSGRLSSSSLNLQNIAQMGGGKNLKRFIIPDLPDHVLVNVDIKAAEIRCLLAYAKEQSLIDAILKGDDFHCTTASEVWLNHYTEYKSPKEFYHALVEAHNAVEPTVKQQDLQKRRKMTKAVNFGLIYGITRYGLKRDLGCTEEEAQEVIDTYFARYRSIKKYMDDTNRLLRQNKEVQSLTMRKRRFPRYELNSFQAYRQAINFRIQNIASDLVVRCIGDMYVSAPKDLDARLVLTVHDSILLSMPKKNLHRLEPYFDKVLVQTVKEKYSWLPVPFDYDIEWGYNYGEMIKLTKDDYEVDSKNED